MQTISVGFLSLIPPILAIVLALCTKEVISSLIIGILSGGLIYALNTGGGIIEMSSTAFEAMAKTVGSPDKFNIILFLALLGSLVYVVTKAGGSQAYGDWASKKLKNRKAAQLATSALGVIIFIDDYFNCLTVGTVMKPITDKFKISRAKLAYIIDATAAPVCIIAPISSWAAAVGSTLYSTGSFPNELAAFISTIPYNLYAILTILMVLTLSISDLEFGPMEKVEYEAQTQGKLGAIDINAEKNDSISTKGTVWDLVIPILSLIVFSIFAMIWNGGYWSGEANSLSEAFGNCDASAALVLGGFWALILTFCLFIPRKLLSFREFMGGISEGIKSMVPAYIILTLAWTIGAMCQDYLGTGVFVGELIKASHLPLQLIPFIVFLVAAGLSFSIGTAWGTFAIFIPIVVFICQASAPELMVVTLSATLAGSVFGDHCSPISDTTILSSTGAGCNHIQHVSTQIPYAFTVAVCCAFGYLISGFTYGNLPATLLSSIGLLIVALVILHKRSTKKIMLHEKGKVSNEM
ncbi:MAG: Na+/H+ antiporter NhaC family protein [Eubacteriaceae bacterium]|nr:Na+/H+ antiporter NhaC family protein [Eubacteriaceae bacterium]